MSNKGMSKDMYEYLKSISSNVKYDLDKGLVITPKGTNGTICSTTGYLRFKVNNRLLQVHQFLAVLYFGERCIGLQVNHIDGNKMNNKKDNLEIVSQQDNLKHQWDKGMRQVPNPKGSEHGNAKLDESKVIEIRSLYDDGVKISELCRKYDVSNRCIAHVVARRTWKHI